VKFLDLNRIYDNFDWKQVLTPIFENTSFINGSEIEKFEEQVAKYIDCEYAVGVSSGTDALQVALLALGATKDKVVLTTPYTFIATSEVLAKFHGFICKITCLVCGKKYTSSLEEII